MVGFRIALSLGLWIGLTALTAGQFLVVPKGERAGSVSPKAVKAEMHAYGAYATARIEISFATDPNWSSEVDFMMRLPDNSEATGFAYWFQGEYVVAKTVEKERAAQIYQFITSERRDPALVELVGRRQFRVRIAPVDRSKDLRVEIKLVLKRTKGAFALPLTALFKNRLESADFTLTTPEGWRENWGREGKLEGGRRIYRFESKPWTAKTDWRTSPPPTPVVASVGRPAQGEGTILVSYTAPKAQQVRLSAPKGVLAHVYPRQANLKAGDTVTFAARVRANAPTSTTLLIGSHTWKQSLPKQAFTDRSAVVLWGADHVNVIKDRAQIRQWGMWLGIPTKETSWLAVPKAEEEMLKQARLRLGYQEYWMTVGRYGKNSKQAVAGMLRLQSLYHDANPQVKRNETVDVTKDWLFADAGFDVLNILGQQYAKAIAKMGKSSAKAKEFSAGMQNLLAPKTTYRYQRYTLRDAQVDAIEEALDSRVALLLGYDDKQAPRTGSSRDPELIRLWSALSNSERSESGAPYYLQEGLKIAEGLRLEVKGYDEADNRQIARNAIKIAPIFGSVKQLLGEARAELANAQFSTIGAKWYAWENGQTKTLKPVRERIEDLDELLKKFSLTPSQAKDQLMIFLENERWTQPRRELEVNRPLLSPDQLIFVQHYKLNPLTIKRRLYRDEWHQTAAWWASLYYQIRQDPAEFATVRAKLDYLAKELELKAPSTPDEVTNGHWNVDARDNYVLYLRRYGPDHPKTLKAKRAMEEKDRRLGKPKRIGVRADILRLGYELDNLSYRTLTPEESKKRDELERRQRELFAKMGDPLLIVVAPPTASVSARLPDGRLVELTWNSRALRWEYRFDLPPGSVEGTVLIPVWIRTAGATVESRVERIHVDQTSPKMEVEWTRTESGWRVTVKTEAAVARVNVALPDGRRLVLARVKVEGQLAFWHAEISGVIHGEAVVVATDAAHNRTEVRRSFSLR